MGEKLHVGPRILKPENPETSRVVPEVTTADKKSVIHAVNRVGETVTESARKGHKEARKAIKPLDKIPVTTANEIRKHAGDAAEALDWPALEAHAGAKEFPIHFKEAREVFSKTRELLRASAERTKRTFLVQVDPIIIRELLLEQLTPEGASVLTSLPVEVEAMLSDLMKAKMELMAENDVESSKAPVLIDNARAAFLKIDEYLNSFEKKEGAHVLTRKNAVLAASKSEKQAWSLMSVEWELFLNEFSKNWFRIESLNDMLKVLENQQTQLEKADASFAYITKHEQMVREVRAKLRGTLAVLRKDVLDKKLAEEIAKAGANFAKANSIPSFVRSISETIANSVKELRGQITSDAGLAQQLEKSIKELEKLQDKWEALPILEENEALEIQTRPHIFGSQNT